ncbi:hypothetical protein VNO77_07231 [Canavalia gladiata]|uniref:Uncharacterized protein n=1 Tax=Canavalia gladiata TaxID=3824 RepID=A0AAN9MB87_CANGL
MEWPGSSLRAVAQPAPKPLAVTILAGPIAQARLDYVHGGPGFQLDFWRSSSHRPLSPARNAAQSGAVTAAAPESGRCVGVAMTQRCRLGVLLSSEDVSVWELDES